MPSTFGYWAVQGYGQPIRFLLEYCGEDYQEKKYTYAPAPNYTENWLKEKFTLDLDFPNLPWYNDGKVNITQSHTILRYLSMKYGMDPECQTARTRIALCDEEILDFRKGMVDTCYNWSKGDLEQLKKDYVEKLPSLLKRWEDFLGDRPWLAGDMISYVDFAFWHYLDIQRYMDPDYIKDFPKLQEYHKRFADLPKIKAYIESDRFLKWPLFGVTAEMFGQ